MPETDDTSRVTGSASPETLGSLGLSLWGLFNGERRRLLLSLTLASVRAALAIPVAALVRGVMDEFGRGSIHRGSILPPLGLILIISILGAVAHHTANVAVRRSIGRLRERLIGRILELPKNVHDGRERMRFHDLVVTDTESVRQVLTGVVTQIVPNGLLALVLIVILAFRSPILVVALGVSLTVSQLVGNSLWKRLLHAQRELRSSVAEFGREVATSLRTLEQTWYWHGSALEFERHRSRIRRMGELGEDVGWRLVVHQVGHHVVFLLVLGVLLAAGIWNIRQLSMSPGAFLANFVILFLVVRSIRPTYFGLDDVIRALESWKALCAFERKRFQQPYRGTQCVRFSGRIDVEGVSFRYKTTGRNRQVLDQVSLRLQPGTITVLTGVNGSGKSTLLQLLLGLYRPDKGVFRADGIPYDVLDISHLRQQIGVVPQDPQFRMGTVWQNLVQSRPDADAATVAAALRWSSADSVVAELPLGLQTDVGDHGALLSGGQRQRLALARVLIGNPALLVLDEPTNHADEQGVAGLITSLRSLKPSVAILVISHLPSLVDHADQVLHLNQGRLSSIRRDPHQTDTEDHMRLPALAG